MSWEGTNHLGGRGNTTVGTNVSKVVCDAVGMLVHVMICERTSPQHAGPLVVQLVITNSIWKSFLHRSELLKVLARHERRRVASSRRAQRTCCLH